MLYSYKWKIKDGYPAKDVKKHGLKVFSTFACGGGSTMGYKLAGYDVIGANDIDPQMARVYKHNHDPLYFFEAPIGDLLTMDLPEELYNLDILDGSPPCSTFSMAGSREKGWKNDKKFKEGQAKQVLSDLFFDWIKLVERLQPKVAIAENVKGMLFGNARAYTKAIVKELNRIGYHVQLFSLNAATMGVPQARERVFFICTRMSLGLPKIELKFDEKPITFGEAEKECSNPIGKELSDTYREMWRHTRPGKSFSSAHEKGSFFNSCKVSPDRVMGTITATSGGRITHYAKPNDLSDEMLALCGSYPLDYEYLDVEPKYLIGMSVPPVMTAMVADQVYKQLLSRL